MADDKLYSDYLKNPDGSDTVGPITIGNKPPAPAASALVPGVTVGGYDGGPMTPASASSAPAPERSPFLEFLDQTTAPAKKLGLGLFKQFMGEKPEGTFDESNGGLVQVGGKPVAGMQQRDPATVAPIGPPTPAQYAQQHDGKTPPPGTVLSAPETRTGQPRAVGGGMGGMGGMGGGAPGPKWVDTAYGPAEAIMNQHFADAPSRAMDASIDQRLQLQQYRETLARQQADAEAQRDAAKLELDRQQQAKEKAENDFAAAQKAAAVATIDPHKFWADKGAAGSMMSIISVALGALGSSLTHTPNQALEMMNAEIDRNIKAQEADMDNKNKASDTMLAQLRDQTGNLESAKAAYKMAATQAAQAELAKQGVTDQDNALSQALTKQLDDIQLSHAKYLQDTHQLVQPKPMGGGPVGAATSKTNLTFTDPMSGKTYVASNEKSRDEMATASAAIANAKAAGERLKSLIANRSITAVTGMGSDANDIKTAQANFEQAMHEVVTRGGTRPMRDSERAELEQFTGNGTGFIPRPENIDAFINQHADDLKRDFKTQDVKEVAEGYVRDPNTGELKPASSYTGSGAANVGAPLPGSFK